jgi:peptide-methionine (S)-S-oxide reductase
MKLIVLALMTLMFAGFTWREATHPSAKPELKTATFAAGCFWGVQASFDRVPGVVSTEAGYTGGSDSHPTHASVATAQTGHVEAVRVTYDASKISYAELLDAFWSCHNPTVDLSTGPGEGPGRSMIFVSDPLQDRIARQSFDEVSDSRRFNAPIMTRIVPAAPFYPAEAEHQHFADRNGATTRCALPGPPVYTQLAASAKRLRTVADRF